MLSTGQWIFAIAFIIVFVTIMVIAYRKDGRQHRKNYKGSIWVLLGFIGFILLLFVVKMLLKE